MTQKKFHETAGSASPEPDQNVSQAVAFENHIWKETFDAFQDWVCIVDRNHTIIQSNSSCNKFIGFSTEQVIGKTCYQIIHGMDCPMPDCPLTRSIKSHQRENLEIQLKNGRWIMVSVDPIKNETGSELFVHVARDITEIKNRENETVNNQKAEAFNILSGGIAHDYNNLLSVIWGNISLLKEEITDTSQQEFFEEAENACEQARYLTHQFITLAEGATFETGRHSIGDILTDAIEKTGVRNTVTISLEIEEPIPAVEADQNYLTIAFQNIIQNSMDAITGEGHIQIKAEMESFVHNEQGNQTRLKISVKDTGIGITRASLVNIFDPYFTTKGMGIKKGAGLGLSVSKAIITKHWGNIHVSSAVGQGTTVIVTLPLPETNLNRQIAPDTALEPKKPVILYMEDDPSLRKLSQRMLERLNCTAIAASCSKEAIEAYMNAAKNNIVIDLILLDQDIKEGAGGIRTLKELRKCGYENEAIVVTGSPNSPAILDYKKYGFDGRILKPYTKKELEAVINQFISI